MMSGPSLEERFQGCLLGLAIGDALGYATEFLALPEIHKRYGSRGIQDLCGNPALHSDDTQMSLAVAQSLIRAGNGSLESLMEVLGKEFLRWLRSPENDRSPGNTSIKGCRNLESGIPWNESGIFQSKGCGANMRVAPIGLYYWWNPAQLRRVARASALVTHAHPTALVAAEATALCVSWAIQGIPPSQYMDRIRQEHSNSVNLWDAPLGECWKRAGFSRPGDYLGAGWAEVLATLDRVPGALRQDGSDICEAVGGGWVANEALACALVCVLKSPQDYGNTIRAAANTSGDSDSIASIAGAISGALLGSKAIPRVWKRKIENRQSLTQLSKQLYLSHQQRQAAEIAFSGPHGV